MVLFNTIDDLKIDKAGIYTLRDSRESKFSNTNPSSTISKTKTYLVNFSSNEKKKSSDFANIVSSIQKIGEDAKNKEFVSSLGIQSQCPPKCSYKDHELIDIDRDGLFIDERGIFISKSSSYPDSIWNEYKLEFDQSEEIVSEKFKRIVIGIYQYGKKVQARHLLNILKDIA